MRTLQYYDRIGLLTADRDGAERRVYRPAHLLRLQQIRFLVGSGLSLAEIGRALDPRATEPLTEILGQQVRALEERELRLRGQRQVLAGLVIVLREHPEAALPPAAIAALTNLDATLFRFPALDPPAAPELGPHQVQSVLSTYFTWKAAAVQALVLVENQVRPDSAGGRRLGRDQAEAYAELARTDPELMELHLQGAAEADRWPEHDRELHQRTKEYLDSCETAYLAHVAGAGSSPSPSSPSPSPD